MLRGLGTAGDRTSNTGTGGAGPGRARALAQTMQPSRWLSAQGVIAARWKVAT